MNTIILPRAGGWLRAAAGFPIRGPVRAMVRDRVVMVFALSLLALGVLDAAQLSVSVGFVAGALIGIAPFLLLAVAIAAFAAASGADRLIARAFSGSPGRTIVLAAVVGALSPFCSCGVIPLIAAMLRAGVPLAPVMAFWLASPIMDPEMFVLTAAGVASASPSPRPWRPWPWGCSAVSRCVRSNAPADCGIRSRRRWAQRAEEASTRGRRCPSGGASGKTSTGGIASFVNRCTPAPFSSSGCPSRSWPRA